MVIIVRVIFARKTFVLKNKHKKRRQIDRIPLYGFLWKTADNLTEVSPNENNLNYALCTMHAQRVTRTRATCSGQTYVTTRRVYRTVVSTFGIWPTRQREIARTLGNGGLTKYGNRRPDAATSGICGRFYVEELITRSESPGELRCSTEQTYSQTEDVNVIAKLAGTIRTLESSSVCRVNSSPGSRASVWYFFLGFALAKFLVILYSTSTGGFDSLICKDES